MCEPTFISFFGGGGPGALKLEGDVALDGTLRFVVDQAGTKSGLKLSTNQIELGTNTANNYLVLKDYFSAGYYGLYQKNNTLVNFAFLFSTAGDELYLNALTTVNFWRAGVSNAKCTSSGWEFGLGTHTINAYFSLKGSGGNIQSWRSSANTEVVSISNSGQILSSSNIVCGETSSFWVINRLKLRGGSSDGVGILSNQGQTGFTRLVLGTDDAVGASFVKNGTAVQIKNGDGTNFTTIEPLEVLTRAPSGGTAKKIKFGESIAVTDGGLTALGIDTQWLVEIEGVNYYMLGGSSQFA